jgi:hypothetical protein
MGRPAKDRSHVTDAFVAFRLLQHSRRHKELTNGLSIPAETLRLIARECYGQKLDYKQALKHIITVFNWAGDGCTNAFGFTPHARAEVEAVAGLSPRPEWARVKERKPTDITFAPTILEPGRLIGQHAPFIRAALRGGTLEVPHVTKPDSGLIYSRLDLSTEEREQLLVGFWEVDIRNAWPTVIAQRFPELCQTWAKFCANRDAFYSDLMATGLCRTRDDAKQLCLVALSAKKMPRNSPKWLYRMNAESKAACESVDCQFKGGEESNWYKFLGRLAIAPWQQAMLATFGQDVIGMFLVDGCFLGSEPTQEQLQHVTRLVQEQTGILFDLKVRRLDQEHKHNNVPSFSCLKLDVEQDQQLGSERILDNVSLAKTGELSSQPPTEVHPGNRSRYD